MTVKVKISGDGKEIDVIQTRSYSGLHERNVHVYTRAEAFKILKELNRLLVGGNP